jgi:hypothetical protein
MKENLNSVFSVYPHLLQQNEKLKNRICYESFKNLVSLFRESVVGENWSPGKNFRMHPEQGKGTVYS